MKPQLNAYFRPCIDLHQGKVKQIVGASLGSSLQENFISEKSAEEVAHIFNRYGLSQGHICLLDHHPETLAQGEAVLKAFPQTWQLGGGLTPTNASKFLAKGAAKIILTSALLADISTEAALFSRAQYLADTIGASNLVFDLSVRSTPKGFQIAYNKWQRQSPFFLTESLLFRLKNFTSEFLIHHIDREGKKSGFQKELISFLSQIAKKHQLPIVYAGGIASKEDIASLQPFLHPYFHFTIGSGLSLFGGTLDLDDFLTPQHAL